MIWTNRLHACGPEKMERNFAAMKRYQEGGVVSSAMALVES